MPFLSVFNGSPLAFWEFLLAAALSKNGLVLLASVLRCYPDGSMTISWSHACDKFVCWAIVWMLFESALSDLSYSSWFSS